MRLHPDVITVETDDGTVLLHQKTGRYWQLNITGTHVMRSLTAGRTPDEIADDLAARHQLDPRQTRSDVMAVISHLHAAQLLETTS